MHGCEKGGTIANKAAELIYHANEVSHHSARSFFTVSVTVKLLLSVSGITVLVKVLLVGYYKQLNK